MHGGHQPEVQVQLNILHFSKQTELPLASMRFALEHLMSVLPPLRDPA